jgi:hypothetical protein
VNTDDLPPAPPQEPQDDDDGGGQAAGAAEIALAAWLVGQFSPRYRYVELEEQRQQVLYAIDPRTHEIASASTDTMLSQMRFYLGNRVRLKDANAAATRAMDIMRNASEYRIREKQVAPLLLEDTEPSRWCYRRLPITSAPLHVAPTRYQEILDRVDDPESVRPLSLWIGSLMDPNSDRSQYLFLYGEGGNGKSSLALMLATVLGRAAISLRASTFTSKFGKAPCANRRLVIFDDTKNASFMASGDFREATGSDTLAVERKGKDVINMRNDLKFLITSNRLPELDGDHADMRRNIFVKLKKYDGHVTGGVSSGFVRELLEQGPDVLRYCYTLYREHVAATGSSIIATPAVSFEAVHDLSLEGYAEDYFHKHFAASPNDTMARSTLHDVLAVSKPPTYNHSQAIQRYFNQRFRVVRENRTGPRVYVGVRRDATPKSA